MADPISQRIQGDIDANDVMLYMKGTPMFPQCGFSARVIQILTHMGVPFQSANVLEDAELREGVKQFSPVADHSAAVREGRVRRRLRHRDRDVPERRTGDADEGAWRPRQGVTPRLGEVTFGRFT